MSILDAILEAPTVTANDDLGDINWVRGMTDPGEMVACGAYQQLRRLNGETDEAYYQRLKPLIAAIPEPDRTTIIKAGIKAAQERAGHSVNGAGLVELLTVGEWGWSGLGLNVSKAVSLAEIKELARPRVGYHVSKRPNSYQLFDGSWKADPGSFALVRDDTEARLSTVGPDYVVLQNMDVLDFFGKVFGKYDVKMESVGTHTLGRVCWAQANIQALNFRLPGGDDNFAYAMLSNKHGGGAIKFFPTSQRAVCKNTHGIAMGRDGRRGISIRHTGDLKGKVGEAQKLFGAALKRGQEFKEQAETLFHTPLEVKPYAAGVLDTILKVSEAGQDLLALRKDPLTAAIEVTEAEKELERRMKRFDGLLKHILDAYESPAVGAAARGSAWGALNAVTRVADHVYGQPARGTSEEMSSRRLESILEGASAQLKEVAFSEVLLATKG